jgi:tRNA(fMet)-specific endonuclease VapC
VTLYLLDSNIVSDVVWFPKGLVAARITAAGEGAIATSIIVASELRYGAEKKRSGRLAARLEAILDELTVLPLEPPVDYLYATIRTQLEQAGTPIGANDLWIAAHAMTLDRTLVTDNVGEFGRVDGLRLVNWLR